MQRGEFQIEDDRIVDETNDDQYKDKGEILYDINKDDE